MNLLPRGRCTSHSEQPACQALHWQVDSAKSPAPASSALRMCRTPYISALFGELWQGEAQTTWLGKPLQLQRCMGQRLLNAGPRKVPFPHQNFQRGSEQVTPTSQVKGMKKIDRQHLDAKTSAQCQLRSTLPWKGCPLSATPGSIVIHIGVGVVQIIGALGRLTAPANLVGAELQTGKQKKTCIYFLHIISIFLYYCKNLKNVFSV